MAKTIKSVLERVVGTLNDDASVTWTLHDLVRYLNDGQMDMHVKRPDLFLLEVEQTLASGHRQTLPDGGSLVGSERSIVVSFGAGSSSSARGSIDGNAPALGTVSIPAATYTRRVIGANAGASNSVGSYYLGIMSELFVANIAFNSAQEDLTHGYLAWKYGREGALPVGHAYKTFPPIV